ncbi:teichoic acid transport system ATP-binding protein [Paenibacillus forsythiae]|uniref:Teichoic acid transport system ATP-binding protein n=1 Tax=Paenibacillus forsythiae TaxID=365616 RepID=A0ABU3HDJ0_9BACL|nr:teichoic acid transport system ATP-binding protein [Paenibacillus forsythiae]
MAYKVKFQHVSKSFKMYIKNSEKLLELFSVKKNIATHRALNDISFEVSEGDVVGIIGLNGSGKSTLSNLIAGVTIPTEGEIQIEGTAALIAISSGLNGQLTGYDNIELKGLMMGLSKKQIAEIRPKVIEFAELGKFINQPVKVYSSGMKARLGFAISVHIDPDILVIDEALSVGDQTFTDRCLNKINEFKSKGKTIFFISHSLSQVKSFCDKAIWLHFGNLQEFGEVETVISHYKHFLATFNKMSEQEKKLMREEHWGSGKIV